MHRVVADTFKERLALPIFRYYENEILFDEYHASSGVATSCL
jgi:hypothetical protein